MIKAIIFDIDGTLTPGNSWTAFTRDIGASVADHLAVYKDHLDGKIGLDESKQKLLAMWQATGLANKSHIEGVYKTWPIKHDAEDLIKWLKDNGYVVCLITGSVGIYAKHMADRLGVDHYYANAELYFDDEGHLSNFHYTADQADVKLKQFKEFCQSNNLQMDECAAVGDGDNDIELFRATGKGILVEGEKVADELRKASWKTVDNLIEVKALVQSQ